MDIKTDAEGRFEIIVSASREANNWLRMSSYATEIYARAYMFVRIRDEPATFRIESLDTPKPRRLGRKDAAERLRAATRAGDPHRLGDDPSERIASKIHRRSPS